MSLSRRIRHQTSRRQLLGDAFFIYIVAFAFLFLRLHFVGIRHYYPSFHREYLPVNTAAIQALCWALIGPVLAVLHQYVFKRSDLWASYWDLDWQLQRLLFGGALVMVLATVFAWRLMLPFWGLAGAVPLYLRFSRSKDSL